MWYAQTVCVNRLSHNRLTAAVNRSFALAVKSGFLAKICRFFVAFAHSPHITCDPIIISFSFSLHSVTGLRILFLSVSQSVTVAVFHWLQLRALHEACC